MTSLLTGMSADAGNFSSKNGARLSLSIDAQAEAGQVRSKLVFYDANSGGIREHANLDWKIVSLTSARRAGRLLTFALGEDGQVVVVEKEEVWRNDIPRATFADRRLGPMRKIRAVGESIVAVGMNRQVYLLDDAERWQHVSPPRTDGEPVTGFEAVVGMGPDDFVCAGWQGEIWRRRKGSWKQRESPTTRLILDLATDSKKVYGCGLGGLLIQSSAAGWRVLSQERFNRDLYSLACYAGRVFAASLQGVYELTEHKLSDVDYGIRAPRTAHTLCVVPEGMASIGAKDLLFMDANGWKRLE